MGKFLAGGTLSVKISVVFHTWSIRIDLLLNKYTRNVYVLLLISPVSCHMLLCSTDIAVSIKNRIIK